MKNTIKILAIFFIISCKAQTIVNLNTFNIGDNSNKYFKDLDNNFVNFVGTWENTTGNITFRVIIWKEAESQLLTEENSYMDRLFGKFLLIQNAGLPNELIIHNSVKYYSQSNTTTNWSLIGSPGDPNLFIAYLMDTCANGGNSVIEGKATLEINSSTTPLNIHWKVKSFRQLNNGEYLSVPIDCILTKVN